MSIVRLLSIRDGFQLLGVDLDVLALADLVPLDDVGRLDLVPGLRVNPTEFDAVARALVELMEADLLALRRGGKESNRAGNEGQLKVALPISTGRHDYALLRQ